MVNGLILSDTPYIWFESQVTGLNNTAGLAVWLSPGEWFE